MIPSTRRANVRNGARKKRYGRAARTSRLREGIAGSEGWIATAMMLLAGLGGNDLRDRVRPRFDGMAGRDAAP